MDELFDAFSAPDSARSIGLPDRIRVVREIVRDFGGRCGNCVKIGRAHV